MCTDTALTHLVTYLRECPWWWCRTAEFACHVHAVRVSGRRTRVERGESVCSGAPPLPTPARTSQRVAPPKSDLVCGSTFVSFFTQK